MTSFILKIIALITMFCDHFGDAFVGSFSFLNLIGRIAFPIFAFQISEGFIHTKNRKKYFLRLGIFAIISQVPFSLFLQTFLNGSPFSLNVLFTMLLGLSSIAIYQYFKDLFRKDNNELKQTLSKFHLDKLIGIVFALLIGYIAKLLDTDYGFWGVLVIFAFYFFKDNKLAMIISYVTLCVIRYGIQIIQSSYQIEYVLLGIFTVLPIVFISLYNEKQGKKIKYLLYIFYPVHLLVLYLLFK